MAVHVRKPSNPSVSHELGAVRLLFHSASDGEENNLVFGG